MNPQRPIRRLLAAILAVSVAAVGLVGTGVASAAPNPVVSGTVSVGYKPQGIAVTPDGSKVYVTNYGGDNVSVISTATKTVIGTVDVGSYPYDVAITPDGTTAYVTNHRSASVSIIDTATDTVTGTITPGDYPAGVAISPNGTRLYVTRYGNGSLVVIDTATNTVIADVTIGASAYSSSVAVTPDGTHAYVTNSGLANVSAISTATNTVVATISVGSSPFDVAISPDSTTAYVTNSGSVTVSAIDTATNTVSATITAGANPLGIDVSSDGTSVYVTNCGDGTVSVINTTSKTVTNTINVGSFPYDVAISPDDSRAYVANWSSNTVSIIGGTVTGSKPARPTALRATAGDESVSVAFTAGSDGGSPITKYQYRVDNGSWTDAVETSSPITVTGLTNYTDYRIAVRAVNVVGNSSSSKYVAARPRYTGPVLNSVVPTGPSSIRADFSAVLRGGTNGYRYTVTVVESGTTNVVGSCRTKVTGRFCSVTGLVSGTDYDVTVAYWFNFPSDPKPRTTLPSNTVTVSFPAT